MAVTAGSGAGLSVVLFSVCGRTRVVLESVAGSGGVVWCCSLSVAGTAGSGGGLSVVLFSVCGRTGVIWQ